MTDTNFPSADLDEFEKEAVDIDSDETQRQDDEATFDDVDSVADMDADLDDDSDVDSDEEADEETDEVFDDDINDESFAESMSDEAAANPAQSFTPQANGVAMASLPITSEPRVDAALARLSDLQTMPVDEHVEVFEDVQRRLHDTLADLSGQ